MQYKHYFFLLFLLWPMVDIAQQRTEKPVDSLVSMIRKSGPDTVRVSLLLELGYRYLDIDGRNDRDMDSIFVACNRATALSAKLGNFKWKNECLKLRGNYYLASRDFDKGRNCFLTVVKNYQQRRDLNGEARAWSDFGSNIQNNEAGMAAEKFQCFENAISLYRKSGNKQAEIAAFKDEADIHLNEGKLDLAKKEFLQVLAAYKAIGYKNLHHVYYLLAAVYRLEGNLDKELFYGLEVIKSIEATRDMAAAPLFYFRLAETYEDLKMPEKSLLNFQKSLQAAKHNDNDIYSILLQVDRILIATQRKEEALRLVKANAAESPPKSIFQHNRMYQSFAICYEAMGNYKLAEQNYLAMLNYSDLCFKARFYPSEMYFRDYMLVCRFYLALKQYKKAGQYLKATSGLSELKVSPIVLSEIQLMQFKVDSVAGNYLAAIGHFERHKKLEDSIYNVKKIRQIEELSFRYETAQKDKDIKLKSKNIELLKKQGQLQSTRAQSDGLFKKLLAVGVLLLSILLAVLYNRYRLKRKNNLQLQKKQDEISAKNHTLQHLLNDNEWLMKELHHRVKNNLQVIISLLNSQAEFLKDEAAINAVTDSQNRIHAMSLIHQKLYKSESVSSIYMPEFIVDLVDYLKESFKTKLSIYFSLEIDPVTLDVLQAIPVGLILNELITNAIKYAFSSTADATILIKLSGSDDHKHIYLTISDNGRGLPEDFDIDRAMSFGLKLVRGLVEDLNGRFSIESKAGTSIYISF